jgi:hypothetical protein
MKCTIKFFYHNNVILITVNIASLNGGAIHQRLKPKTYKTLKLLQNNAQILKNLFLLACLCVLWNKFQISEIDFSFTEVNFTEGLFDFKTL